MHFHCLRLVADVDSYKVLAELVPFSSLHRESKWETSYYQLKSTPQTKLQQTKIFRRQLSADRFPSKCFWKNKSLSKCRICNETCWPKRIDWLSPYCWFTIVSILPGFSAIIVQPHSSDAHLMLWPTSIIPLSFVTIRLPQDY